MSLTWYSRQGKRRGSRVCGWVKDVKRPGETGDRVDGPPGDPQAANALGGQQSSPTSPTDGPTARPRANASREPDHSTAILISRLTQGHRFVRVPLREHKQIQLTSTEEESATQGKAPESTLPAGARGTATGQSQQAPEAHHHSSPVETCPVPPVLLVHGCHGLLTLTG